MKEEYGDLWVIPGDVRCITTNGTIKLNGHAVMGRGCAKEALNRYGPEISHKLGFALQSMGNHVHVFGQLVTFPVKHEWHQEADLELIRRSCQELIGLVEERGWNRVLLPRPGCGNGRLNWRTVKPAIDDLLDDRIVIVSFREDADANSV